MDTSNEEAFISKYKKIALLGTGSYGTVYLIKLNNTSYALKEINMNSLNPLEKQRAFHEVSFLATLKHQHIIGYRDSAIDHTSGRLSIIMDYAESGDLGSIIAKQKGVPFSVHTTVSWFIQISQALQYIHSQNILHRDLKTQNIFLCGNTIKIGDFGISRLLNNSEDFAKTAIGTPYYLSPEIILRKPYNTKSDIWALGCVLFEISTLDRPFKAKDFPHLMSIILEGKRQSFPIWMKSGLIKQLVGDLLCLNPDQRPSADEILAYPSLKLHFSSFVQSTKDISSVNVTRKAYRSPEKSLKRSASVLNPNDSKFPKLPPKIAENERKQSSFCTRDVTPVIVVTEFQDKFVSNERKQRFFIPRPRTGSLAFVDPEYQDKFQANERKQRSFSTQTLSPAIAASEYQDKFESNEKKPRSASIRATPPGIIVTENNVKFEANERKPRSASIRATPPGIAVTEYQNMFEANEKKHRSASIRATPPGIVTEYQDKFEANEKKARSASIRATPPGIVTENKFEEKKRKKIYVFSRVENKTLDKFPILKPGISSRSNMNITYTVEREEKSNSDESSKPNKLCSPASPYDIDCGYSSEEMNCSADLPDKSVIDYSNNNSEKLSVQKSVIQEEAKTGHSSILGNQTHCDHSQCNQCLLDMMWKNRIRGCISVSKSNGDYLKLKKKLLLIFGHDLFQKVYESLLQEWEGNESSPAQTSIQSFAKLLNYEQVQHLPLVMQLIQLDLVKLAENETCNVESKSESATYL